MSNVRFVGLDVHAATIAVPVAEGRSGEVRSLGVIPNREESVRKMIRKLGPLGQLRMCYEAGPTGYALYWQLAELGVRCEVVAPTLVSVKVGDRVRTDRRDAEKLARLSRDSDSFVAHIFSGLQPSKTAAHPVPQRRQPKTGFFSRLP